MTDTREVTLLLNARNLGAKALEGFGSGIKGIVDTAENAGRRIGQGFENATNAVSNAIGNLTENLLQGGDLGQSVLMFGTYLGGQLAEGLVGQALERMGASSLIAAIGGALSGAGAAIGGLLDTAIGVGMAALPFVLLAAVAAAVVFLVNNPEVVARIGQFVTGVLGTIGDLLGKLPGVLLGAFGAAWDVVVKAVPAIIGSIVGLFLAIPGQLLGLGLSIVTTIVGGLVSLPGKVADVVRQAFANLKIDVGPFHVSAAGVRIDLPDLSQSASMQGLTYAQAHGLVPHHAAGGWVGLNGPELSWVGEQGPEYITPAGAMRPDSAAAGVRLLGVSAADLADLVDRELYFRIVRDAPTDGR